MSALTGDKPGRKPGMSAAERGIRDAAIMAQLHAGDEVKAIAKDHGLTAGQVRKIAAVFELRRTAREDAPLEIIDRVLRTYEEQMKNFALVALQNLEKMPAVALGALKAKADALERYTMLLADIGKLPERLELFRQEAEIVRAGRRLFELQQEVLDGRISNLEAQDELHRLFGVDGETPRAIEGSSDELEDDLPPE